MADKKFNLDFYAKVQTDVGSVKEVVKNLKAQLENLKLPAGATKNFEKSFERLEGQIRDFESLASSGINSLADTKKVQAAWDKIAKSFSSLGFSLKELDTISDQIFPKEVSENIKKANKALENYQNKLKEIRETEKHKAKKQQISEQEKAFNTAQKQFNTSKTRIDEQKGKVAAKKAVWDTKSADYDRQVKQIQQVTDSYNAQAAEVERLTKLKQDLRDSGVIKQRGNALTDSFAEKLEKAKKDLEEAESYDRAEELKELNAAKQRKAEIGRKLGGAKGTRKGTKDKEKQIQLDTKINQLLEEQAKAQAEVEQAQATYDNAIESRKAALKEEIALLEKRAQEAQEVSSANINAAKAEAAIKKEQMEQAITANEGNAGAKEEYETAKANLQKYQLEAEGYSKTMEEARRKTEELNSQLKQLETDESEKEWQELVNTLKQFKDVNLDEAKGDIEEVKRIISQYSIDKIKETPEILRRLQQAASGAEKPIEDVGKAGDSAAEGFKEMNRAARDLENLKDQVLDFFSISNTVQIFKDAVRDAFETVKELDAVMTETAVVTEFSVGDMWDKLPEYSDEANKLGTSIASLYEATTLYYQQGLKSQEAMDVGIETMKMARIANMDAAAATEAMTAALRGFNMEINEMSATRINDVYSELAAITAADTSQIATAMSKTASIASSANMEFETTAALLAQIIETTQEAPETAGTAMKTIIARFTEVKQLFDEGMLTGKDSEGEEININKIDAALKKVGISLSDFLRGEKGIDDIFLELASKWDSLDLATQRYIATTAAGSRQQSRFLAMMGNYERTMELVTAANNSAGASQKQFDKTLESLEAKLQRLKNAWAEFTMGLANNEVIKGAVDLLTEILEKLNQFSDFGSEGIGGIATMLTRLATVIVGLKSAEPIVKGLLKTLGIFKGETEGREKDNMGFAKALLTKQQAKWGFIEKLSPEAEEADKLLKGISEGFKKASGSASLFGKTLLKLSPYIAILAAIGVAVYGIVKSFKAAQKEAKIEAFNNQIEELNSQLSETQDELSEISQARSNLDSLNNTFNNLTKGTTEWKTALIDVNQGVLDLIQKYPSLSKYATMGSSGELKISDEGWNELLEQQQKAITNINAQRLILESSAKKLQTSIDFQNFVIDSYGVNTKEIDKNILKADLKAAHEAYRKGEDLSNLTLPDYKVAKQSEAERAWAETSIRMAEWQDNSGILATMSDATLYDTPAAYLGASLGSMIARWFGASEEATSLTPHADQREKQLANGGYVQEAYKNLVHATEAQYLDLARKFAEDGKVISDKHGVGASDREIISYLEDLGIKDGNEQFDIISILRHSAEEFQQLINAEYENIKEQDRINHQFVTNALTGGTQIMEKDYGDAVANVVSKGIDGSLEAKVAEKEKELSEKVDEEGNKVWTPEKIAAEYARIMGYQAVGEDVYTDGTYSQKVDASQAAMLRAIATEAITVEVKEKAEKTAGAIGKEKEQEKLFDNIFSTDGQEITGAQQSKYYNTDTGIIDYESLAKDMGYEAEGFLNAAQVMARELQLMPADLKKILDNNFKNAAERSKKQRLTTANSIAEYGFGSNLTRDEIYASVAEAEKKMQNELTDIEVRGILDSAIQALGSTGDSQLAQTGIFKLLGEGIEGNAEKFKALSEVITGINWNDPVEASSQIQKHLNSGNATAKEFAQEMMALNSTFLGDASQLQAFFNSSEYEDIASKIAEIKEVQDKVTGADVEELASEYSYLNKMLKNTKMTSEGLAAILNQVSEGALGFEEINDVILAGIKNLGSFGASLDKILAYLNDFDPGRDEGQAQDFIDQASEVVNERVANFEYGNTEARNYITELLGKDYLQGDAQQQMAAMDAAAKWLQGISGTPGAGMQVFKNIAEGKDIMGNTIVGGQQKPEGIDFGYGADGKFFMDIDAQKYGTLEEVTAALGNSNLGGTKTMWDTMLTLMSNYDPTFMQEWEMEQAALAPQRMREEALKIDDKAIVSQKSIDATAQAMYEALGDSTGKSFEDFQKEIVDGLNELGGYEIFDVFNADGTRKELEQLKKDIEGLFGGGDNGRAGLLSNYLIGEEGNQFIDFTSLTKGLETFGLTTQEAFSAALDYVSELPAQLESVKSIMVNGQEISLVDANGELKDLEVVKEEITNVKNAAEEGDTEFQVSTASAIQKIRNYRSEIAQVPRSVHTTFTTSGTTAPPTSGNTNNATNTINKPKGYNSEDRFLTLAEGTENHSKNSLALTGEEGPELVESKEGAYLVGVEGPQMAYINRGDTVHTAEETEEIYKRKGQKVESHAKGKDGTTTGILDLDKIISGSSGGRSGGSSSDGEEEIWENPFDKLYNLLRKIDEELHQRERIERRYEKLLEGIDASAAKIVAVSREELAHLEQERKLQEAKISGRNYQIDEYQKENSDLQQYARFVENDRGERVLRIDWDLIDRVTDTDKGERIEEYVSQLEEWDDDIQEAEEALWEIEDTVAEIKERGKDQYEELEDKIKEAIVQSYQDQIDKLNDINDSINDTNAELLDAIQTSIDKQRQDRDNQRTEDELAEKQRRLLYLQQDTSGANALEILRLQDEIEQGREDYTDTLIDQKISELQKQNDEASKQREKQITLLQAQLDHYIDSGEIWSEVYSLMERGLDENSGLIRGSRLEQILKNADNFSGLSAIGQQEWWREFHTMVAEALAYLELGRQLEDLGIANQEVEMVLPDGSTVKGTVDDQGNVTTADGQVYNNVYQGADGRYYAGENIEEPKDPVIEHPNDGDGGGNSGNVEPEAPKTTTIKKNIKNTPKGYNVRRGASLNASKVGALPRGTEVEIDGYKADWYHIINPLEGFIHNGAITSSVDKTKLKAYKTGGLADFTGPAWLDGTKSRPEIVLNQQDSRNFIQLRDILSSVLSRGNIHTATENNGDILYDIDINVESIGSDYDVEQVANKVKSLINEDARYRNNNTVSLKR